MTRLSPFTFTLTDGHQATFLAPTHSQALELAITWSRARGLQGSFEHERGTVAVEDYSPRSAASLPGSFSSSIEPSTP
jgi:hypothetical protein